MSQWEPAQSCERPSNMKSSLTCAGKLEKHQPSDSRGKAHGKDT